MKTIHIFIAILFCCLISSCIVPFEPKDLVSSEPVLVVEGSISVKSPFEIILSRTVNLDYGTNPTYVSDATVVVLDDAGNTYPSLGETSDGHYAFDFSSSSSINTNNKFWLKIITKTGETYESEPQKPLSTPSFELSYVHDDEKQEMRVMVSTNNPEGTSKFYMWTYQETWDYVSYLTAYCYFDTKSGLVDLGGNPWMHRCWKKRNSSDIVLTSTERLSEDRVKDFVIQTIPYTDNSITQHYLIRVTQTVISETAYYYMENMRKNSNDIGGIFSPQPNEIKGNITCTSDPATPALGYVMVSDRQTASMLVDCRKLPKPKEETVADTIVSLNMPFRDMKEVYTMGYRPYLIDAMSNSSQWNIARCVDCRMLGGTVEVPEEWPAGLPTK